MSLINPRNSLELLSMHYATRKKLRSEIEVYLTKFPNAQIKDIREFLKSGTTSQLWGNLKKSTRNSFLGRNVRKILLLDPRKKILLEKWSGKVWAPESPIFVSDLYLEYQYPHGRNQSMVSCMLIWSVKKLNQLFCHCVLKEIKFGRMMEHVYTDALMLSKQWRQASDPELIPLSRLQRWPTFGL